MSTSPQAAVQEVPLAPGLFTLDARGERVLAATRCRACDARFFPPRSVCARCLSVDVEAMPLEGTGTVYTYTVVHQSTPQFRTPYVLAYADLPEGVRVLAPLEGVEPAQARIGLAVRLRVEPLRTDPEGRAVVGYRLYPVASLEHASPAAGQGEVAHA